MKAFRLRVMHTSESVIQVQLGLPFCTKYCVPMDGFVSPGLRTLCFAVADISESLYQQWQEVHHRACTSLQNRALKMEESYELIEKVSTVYCTHVLHSNPATFNRVSAES